MKIPFIWFVVGISTYLGILLALLFLSKDRAALSDREHFFLGRSGKRGIHPLLLLVSYAATVYSAFTAVGMPGFVHTHGLGAYCAIVFGQVLQAACIVFFGLPLWKKATTATGTISPIEVVARSYHSRVLGMIIVGATVFFVVPHVTTQLVGMGRLIEGATGGEMKYAAGVGILLIVMLVYSELGGLKGIVWTDVVQFVLCVGGMAALAILFLNQEWEGSIAKLFRDVRASDNAPLLSTPGPKSFFTLPMLASYCLLFGLWPIGHPTFSVRYLAQSTKRGFLWLVIGMSIAPLFMFIPGVILGLGGAMKAPALEKGDQVVGVVLALVLETGGVVASVFAFLFVLGALSAAMSTCDSQILATGQIVSRDVVKGVRPDISARGEMRSARIVMFVVLAIAYMIGMADPPLIWKLTILSGVGTAILVPTYLGIFLKKPNLHAAFTSMACGYVVMVVGETMLRPEDVFGFHTGIPAIAASAVVYGVVSVLWKESRAAQ